VYKATFSAGTIKAHKEIGLESFLYSICIGGGNYWNCLPLCILISLVSKSKGGGGESLFVDVIM